MSNEVNNRRHYSEDFKRETVKNYSMSGKPVTAFAQHIGIDQSILHRWVRKYTDERHATFSAVPDSLEYTVNEVRRLKRELAEVRQNLEILRGIVEKSFRTRYEFDEMKFSPESDRDSAS